MRLAWWRSCLTAMVVVVLMAPSPSSALVRQGAPRPPARVADPDDRVLDIGTVSGRPILIVYEDKRSTTLNVAFKSALSKLAKGDRYRSSVVLVPVADVGSYDYWPVRGFVKDAIRDEARKLGSTIYCDWDGTFARALQIQHGTSTVVLIGKGARVLFAKEGKLTDADTRRVLELLRNEVEPQRG